MAEAAIRLKCRVPVMSYSELVAKVSEEQVAAVATEIAKLSHLDFPERCKLMTEKVWGLSGMIGPCVVLGFGSIPYPAVGLTDELLVDKIIAAVTPHGLGHVKYFAGISDMSFFGEASGDLNVVASNTPIWGSSFVMPEAAGYPCVNIGPWGRDYHHWLERVHAPYAFETLPRVLLSVIEAVAKSG